MPNLYIPVAEAVYLLCWIHLEVVSPLIGVQCIVKVWCQHHGLEPIGNYSTQTIGQLTLKPAEAYRNTAHVKIKVKLPCCLIALTRIVLQWSAEALLAQSPVVAAAAGL